MTSVGQRRQHHSLSRRKKKNEKRARERENEAKGCEIAHTFRSMSSKVLLHKGIWQRKASSHNIQLPQIGMPWLFFFFVYVVVDDYFFPFPTLAQNKNIKITDNGEMCRAWICLCFFFSFASTERIYFNLFQLIFIFIFFSFQILERLFAVRKMCVPLEWIVKKGRKNIVYVTEIESEKQMTKTKTAHVHLLWL